MTLRDQIKTLQHENKLLRNQNSEWALKLVDSCTHRDQMRQACKLALDFWRLQNPKPSWQWPVVLRLVYDRIAKLTMAHDEWSRRFEGLGNIIRIQKKVTSGS